MRRNDGYKSLIIRPVQKEKLFQETPARATNVEKAGYIFGIIINIMQYT